MLTGVELPAYGRAAAELTFRLTAPIGDADYQVEVQQLQKNRVLGGSSYALTIGAGSHQLSQDQSTGADEPDGWPYGRGRKFTGIRSWLEVYEKGEAN